MPGGQASYEVAFGIPGAHGTRQAQHSLRPRFQGELNGQRGLVPSNFLEEVPDDVEVYLSDAPSLCSQDTALHAKAKRVSTPPRPAASSRGFLALCGRALVSGPHGAQLPSAPSGFPAARVPA